MNLWVGWAVFALTAVVLGLVGRYFSLRVLRMTAALIVTPSVVGYLTWYGLTHAARGDSSLSSAFARGADALIIALFRLPTQPGHHSLGPGRIGWLVITVLLVFGYRELEAWSLHHQARSLDTSGLIPTRLNVAQQDDAPGGHDALTDQERHDRLAAELKFRLPAVEVRSPPILPGGSRSSELASIAESSGVSGSGLAGAIIRFVGMLWPSPRRIRVRVWVERTTGHVKMDDATRVTVDLDDPRNGASIATKTLAADCLDDAASVVAGYVAQHIFAEDPTAPPWCTGAADGRDLAAMLLARQVRTYLESERDVKNSRSTKIRRLENVACNNLCAGVARYELAQLYDLEGQHIEALWLHANNREQYPRFYRGRYRLAMSLEMIANPDPDTRLSATEVPHLDDALKILHAAGVTTVGKSGACQAGGGRAELLTELRPELLDAAWTELQSIRRYLSLSHVVWRSFRHCDERGILMPYWQLRHRQTFHDGVRIALLLVAARRALNDEEQRGPAPSGSAARGVRPRRAQRLPHARKVMRVATAIAGDSLAIATVLGISSDAAPGKRMRPVAKRLRIRRWPGQKSTRSWQAAYNLACVYAAIALDRNRQLEECRRKPDDAKAVADARRIEAELPDLVTKVVTSLEFAICNPECEMDRPWDWIAHDPDFGWLRPPGNQLTISFRDFLNAQELRDYPQPLGRETPRATSAASPCCDVGVTMASAPVFETRPCHWI